MIKKTAIALLSVFVLSLFADAAAARRIKFRSFGSTGSSQQLVRVMDLPDIDLLRRKDGRFIDLGYKFSSSNTGEWVGHVGSNKKFLTLKPATLKMILAVSQIKLPPIPTASRGEKNVPVAELRRRAKLLYYAKKYKLRVRRYDESLGSYEARVLEQGTRAKYKLRGKKNDETLSDYRSWLMAKAARIDKKRRTERKKRKKPSWGVFSFISMMFPFFILGVFYLGLAKLMKIVKNGVTNAIKMVVVTPTPVNQVSPEMAHANDVPPAPAISAEVFSRDNDNRDEADAGQNFNDQLGTQPGKTKPSAKYSTVKKTATKFGKRLA